MQKPTFLYRYRPLTDDLLDRELSALKDCYLYAPSFSAMNDPMEAFFQTGHSTDTVVDLMLASSGRSTADIYALFKKTVEDCALISFSTTSMDFPMWAYYASNFAGMCLEFDTASLEIGDLQGEPLRQVTYAREALPSFGFVEMVGTRGTDQLILPLTRKRIEWAHEKEWRYITGKVGKKYFLDDSLRQVLLGPRVKKEHAAEVCNALKHRPVTVLQGETEGFDLKFRVIQAACEFANCGRTGSGLFNIEEHQHAQDDISNFLKVPYELLLKKCHQLAEHPNLEEIVSVDLTTQDKKSIYLWATYKLRSERLAYVKRYYDQNLQLLPS